MVDSSLPPLTLVPQQLLLDVVRSIDKVREG